MSTISDAISVAISLTGSPSKLARAVGVSAQAACFWRDGKRTISPDKCVAIEQATGGVVSRRDLRPNDWHLFWPELREPDDIARPDAGDRIEEEIR